MASLGISDGPSVEAGKRPLEQPEELIEETEELDLTGIDEDEIDTYLLTDKEANMKTNLWMKLNGEFLQEMEGQRTFSFVFLFESINFKSLKVDSVK